MTCADPGWQFSAGHGWGDLFRARPARALAAGAGGRLGCSRTRRRPGLQERGYQDAYRALHGCGHPEPSWTWKRIAGHSGGWRIDHIFASAELQAVSCIYHHAWRDEGLSDHSALEADFV